MKPIRRRSRAAHVWLWTALSIALALVTCSPQPTALFKVRSAGVLRVATTNSSTTCYDGRDGPTGYECELLTALAADLGVKLELVFEKNGAAVIEAVASGRADLGAAGLNVIAGRKQPVRFSAPLQQVRLQLVYRSDHERPADPGDLDGRLLVPAESPMAVKLAELRARYPDLRWQETRELGQEDLLDSVLTGETDYAVANSDLVAVNQRYSPRLRVAFDLSGMQNIAWALPVGTDNTLYGAVQDFLGRLGDAGLARARDRWFGHVDEDDYRGVVRFVSDVQTLLPRYRKAFENAGEKAGVDWRLVAAIGYQESHWNPAAVSPTGVRGIMMLTEETAVRLNVADRENPMQSIDGGARYFAQTVKSLPPSIDEPDRGWMALAAYNQGLGHLLDARVLAQRRGKDPDRWVDVRDSLPLLARESWHQQTRYGYARGSEAVNFVANVRSYYDLLVWMSNGRGAMPPPSGAPERPAAKPVEALRSSGAAPAGPVADARR